MLVMGIGNVLMQDDGIGVYLAEELMVENNDERIRFVIGETDVDFCLSEAEEGEFLIILDAVQLGSKKGSIYEMPLSEMVSNFYDKLKSVSSGFASLDWELLDFREVEAVRVDIMVSGEKVDALSTIVFRPKAEGFGRRMVEKLKEVLPKQNFAIAVQAAIGGTIIARETISPFRKDVTAKLYGGDRTRKDKLLEKQKKGKKKMKMIGKVEIPQEAFLSILKS